MQFLSKLENLSGTFFKGNIYLGMPELPETNIEICDIDYSVDWNYLIMEFTSGGYDGYSHSVLIPRSNKFTIPIFPYGNSLINDNNSYIKYAKCHIENNKLYFDYKIMSHHILEIRWIHLR